MRAAATTIRSNGSRSVRSSANSRARGRSSGSNLNAGRARAEALRLRQMPDQRVRIDADLSQRALERLGV